MRRRVEGWARAIFLMGLVAAFFALAAAWPTKEAIGYRIERLAAWWSPPSKRPIVRVELSARKRALIDRAKAAGPGKRSVVPPDAPEGKQPWPTSP